MKLPYQINSSYYSLLYFSGWYPERDILLEELPFNVGESNNELEKFIRALWYITFVKKDYYFDSYQNDLSFLAVYYIFGETTNRLALYDKNDDSNSYYLSLLDNNNRLFCFGTKSGRDILIDLKGRIYEIPDSGDLYYVGGLYYEGLYNIIYNIGERYRAIGNGLFIDEESKKEYFISNL